MPKWIHERAEHILAKHPDMPKSEAFGIATSQAHAVGKSPKSYGTAEGRREAKAKYKTPKDDEHRANPGHLESVKMAAFLDELEKIASTDALSEFLKLADVSIGQWWEQVGGPHLAKGGSHKEFQKMMNRDGIPNNVQAKFKEVAKAKYPEGYATRPTAQSTSSPLDNIYHSALDTVNPLGSMLGHPAAKHIGALATAGLVGRAALAPVEADPEEAPSMLKARLGAYLSAAPAPFVGHYTGTRMGAVFNRPNLGANVGALVGLAGGIYGAENNYAKAKVDADEMGSANSVRAQRAVMRGAGLSSSALARGPIINRMLLPTIVSALRSHTVDPRATALGAISGTGEGMLMRQRNLLAAKTLRERDPAYRPYEGEEKAAANRWTAGIYDAEGDKELEEDPEYAAAGKAFDEAHAKAPFGTGRLPLAGNFLGGIGGAYGGQALGRYAGDKAAIYAANALGAKNRMQQLMSRIFGRSLGGTLGTIGGGLSGWHAGGYLADRLVPGQQGRIEARKSIDAASKRMEELEDAADLGLKPIVKQALAERLIRLGATDIPGTPRLVMRHRDPKELAGLQQYVTDAWERKAAPLKQKVTNFSQKVPTDFGKNIVRGIGHTAIDNPDAALAAAVPFPFVSAAYLAGKKGLEHMIDRVAPLQKAAFLSSGKYLLDQVGKPKIKPLGAEPPDKRLRIKEGMFPTDTPPSVIDTSIKKHMKDSAGIGGTNKQLPGVPNSSGSAHSIAGAKLASIKVAVSPQWINARVGEAMTKGVAPERAKKFLDNTARKFVFAPDTSQVAEKYLSANNAARQQGMGELAGSIGNELRTAATAGPRPRNIPSVPPSSSGIFVHQTNTPLSIPPLASMPHVPVHSPAAFATTQASPVLHSVAPPSAVAKAPSGINPYLVGGAAALGGAALLGGGAYLAHRAMKARQAASKAQEKAAGAKYAFSDSGFGPTGGVFRPQYESYQGRKPIPAVTVMDPHLKQGGNCTKKLAFEQSGFGEARSFGPYAGNGGNHASYQGRKPIPSVITEDPHLTRKIAAIPTTPKGILHASMLRGQPKVTAPPGPSVAQISKPIGYGRNLPGANKNGI